MIIHIVRHAEAVDRSGDVPEEHRFLTRRGRKRFRKTAKALRKAGIAPDVIITSPMVRAVQTADILAEKLRHKGELVVAQKLSSGFKPQSLDELLDPYPQAQEIALVGHDPDLSELTALLLGVEESSLRKGEVASFDRAAGGDGKADFVQLATGGGRIITSRNKALARLQGQQQQ